MAAPLGRTFLINSQKSCSLFKPFSKDWITKHVQRRFFNSRELKRFYKNATISQYEGWYEINLDQRKLRTPGGQLFRVPNEALALAIATEWNAQAKVIKRHNMHLTSLANTAIDNPMHKTRDQLIRSVIHFLETDTLSFRTTEPEELFEHQQKEWDPVVKWIEERYKIEVPYSTSIIYSPDLPPSTVDTLTKQLQSRSDWALVGYSFAVDAVKSLVLTLALMDKFISVEKCAQLARLEQDFQVEKWGNVEWYHDIDVAELRSRLSAAALFVHWSSETIKTQEKAMFARPI